MLFRSIFAALLTETWWTLALLSLGYLVLMPISLMRYARVKRRKGATLQ